MGAGLTRFPRLGRGALAALLLAGPLRAEPAPPLPELPPAPARAAAATGFDAGEAHVRVRLLADAARVSPGQPFRAGALFQLDPGWYLYWKNPGETGEPPRVELAGEGLEAGPLQWPAPRAFPSDGDASVDYGYQDEVLLWRELRFSPSGAGAAAGSRELRARIEFLICRLACVPGEADLQLPLAVAGPGEGPEPAARAVGARFDAYSAQLPVTPEALGAALRIQRTREVLGPGEAFGLSLELRGCPSEPTGCKGLSADSENPLEVFLPERSPGISLRPLGVEALPEVGGLRVQVEGRAGTAEAAGASELRGLLAVRDAKGNPRHVEFQLALPRTPAPGSAAAAAGAPAAARIGLPAALGLGLLGGLLLNAMPCVLPVLAVKLFALVENSRRSRGEALAHAAAYTLGSVASLLLLAALVAALRAAGTSVGWGFQFQEPRYVAALCAMCFLMALDFFGLFHVGAAPTALADLGQQARGPLRSLFEGGLVVVLATPCSAPFLGAALGFAFAGSGPEIAAVFAAVGLGLAAPFAAAAARPGLLAFLPRPGPWMRWLRAALGLGLVATALWLLSLLPAAAGGAAVAAVLVQLAALFAVALALGAFQRAARTAPARAAAAGLLLLFAAGPALLPVAPAPASGATAPLAPAPVGTGRGAFSPEAVRTALEAGRPGFVIFTADWCLTCKLNERAVLSDGRVEEALRALGFAVFVADWTHRDEGIRAELLRHGRAGVPVYLVYDPRRPQQPVVLSELLSVEGLLRELRAAAPAGGAPGLGAS